ncbi:hypothetical protein Tco_1152575 [Tanacetum coccineum]
MPLDGIHDDDKLQFVEEPVEIMERETKRLKRSRIPLVKDRWNSRRGPEFTREREDSGHLREAHIHYSPVFLEGTPARGTYSLLPGVLGGDTCEGYIFITARVFLEGTPVMGTYGFHYCPSVLGGDTSDGYIVMDAPTSSALAGLSGEGQDDTTDIKVDRIHPIPVAEVVFPAATSMVKTGQQRGEAIRDQDTGGHGYDYLWPGEEGSEEDGAAVGFSHGDPPGDADQDGSTAGSASQSSWAA